MSRQIPLPLPHREAMGTDDYVVTASNREAAAWVNAWPTWPSPCLMIIGPSGSGKTHLLNLWRQKSGAALVAADDFRRQTATVTAAAGTHIALDDADTLAGDTVAEETLFHLYNLLREANGFLCLATSTPPAQWFPGLPDLRSRLVASPAAVIGEPDDELLTMLLVKQFHDRQIDVGADVIAYLLPRIERSAGALRNLVAMLDQAALAEGRRVTVALARRLLEEQSFPIR